MKNLKEKRLAMEKKNSETILLKIWDNFFKCVDGVFKSFGKGNSCGSWFNCGEEEIERIREAVLSGNFEAVKRIPGNRRVYRLPSEWMGEEI